MRRVVVLMGGESQERDVSRVTGTAVAKALAERGHDVTLLDTHDGVLPLGPGASAAIGDAPPEPEAGAALAMRPSATLSSIQGSLAGAEAVFIALHGGWGEDGTIQAFFELLGVPYTGSGVMASALAMDKERAKHVLRSVGIPTPEWAILEIDAQGEPTAESLAAAREKLPGRVVVKPSSEGSTVGLSLVDAGVDLREAGRLAGQFGRRVLVEEFISGRELTAAILGDEPLPLVEIFPDGGLYSYEAKYTKGKSRYEVPASLPVEQARELQRLSGIAFRALGAEGFGRVDWRLRADGSAFCLELNTIPGMTPLSLVPMAARAHGIEFGELIERIVELGIDRGTKRGGKAAATGAGS